jgi:solute carrier family 25 (mitochondrial folate transporter), member 32
MSSAAPPCKTTMTNSSTADTDVVPQADATMVETTTRRKTLNLGSRKLTIRNEPHHSMKRDRAHFTATFIAGVGSGALASIVCAPLDLMRTRMQVWGDIQKKSGGNVSDGPKAAFTQIIEKEGWKGMFRGLGMTLITVPVFWGIYFPLYDQTKHYLGQQYPPEVYGFSPSWIHMSSAVFTGAVADLICNPLFVVRTRLQTQALHQLLEEGGASHIHESGIVQTTKELYQRHGIPIFWRGMTANLIGLSHCAVQFPSYEFLKKTFRERHTDDSPETAFELLLASGMAKMCASLISYPHEVLRSRMMDSRAVTGPTLSGTAKHIYANEGIAGFYSGLPVALIRVIPNCCMTFLSYEMILRYCKGWSS